MLEPDSEENQLTELFEQGCVTDGVKPTRKPEKKVKLRIPGVQFCGIENQGATCYLNSLLQTLFLTTEFRVGLFKADPHHLIQSKRTLAYELQCLFARKLLSNKEMVNTRPLTDSFGWENHEGMEQQDVQELNRVLFNALNHFLDGTAAENLINDLYKGSVGNKITCDVCNWSSEREEAFMDLTLSVSNSSGLTESFENTYNHTERFDGNNQYSCPKCERMVDASMSCKLKKLPPILTISLLKFVYNFDRGQRYKENKPYSFPLTIDFGKYYEGEATQESLIYELFSVIVHSGGTHCGHYHALIRDIDQLAEWNENEAITGSCNVAPTKTDDDSALDVSKVTEDPVECLRSILVRANGTMSLEDIMSKLGPMWSKGVKRRHGTIRQVIARHTSHFTMTSEASDKVRVALADNKPVLLNGDLNGHGDGANGVLSNSQLDLNTFLGCGDGAPSEVVDGDKWFKFNDGEVCSVSLKKVARVFSGRDSAYMLFYRRANLKRDEAVRKNPVFGMPHSLVEMVQVENEIYALETQVEEANPVNSAEPVKEEPPQNGAPEPMDQSGGGDSSETQHGGDSDRSQVSMESQCEVIQVQYNLMSADHNEFSCGLLPHETENPNCVEFMCYRGWNIGLMYEEFLALADIVEYLGEHPDFTDLEEEDLQSYLRFWLVDERQRLVRCLNPPEADAGTVENLLEYYSPNDGSQSSVLLFAIEKMEVPISADVLLVRVLVCGEDEDMPDYIEPDTRCAIIRWDLREGSGMPHFLRAVNAQLDLVEMNENMSIMKAMRVYKYLFQSDEWEPVSPKKVKRRKSKMNLFYRQLRGGHLFCVRLLKYPSEFNGHTNGLTQTRNNSSPIPGIPNGKGKNTPVKTPNSAKKAKSPEQGIKIRLPTFDSPDGKSDS